MDTISHTVISIESADKKSADFQIKILAERLKTSGFDVLICDFNNLKSESNYLVQRYKSGVYGAQEDVGEYLPGILGILSRFDSYQDAIEKADSQTIILTNRTIASDMLELGLQINQSSQRNGLYTWLEEFEDRLPSDIKPSVSILLHEVNSGFEQANFSEIESLFPKYFSMVETQKVDSVTTVAAKIWQLVEPSISHLGSKEQADINYQYPLFDTYDNNFQSHQVLDFIKAGQIAEVDISDIRPLFNIDQDEFDSEIDKLEHDINALLNKLGEKHFMDLMPLSANISTKHSPRVKDTLHIPEQFLSASLGSTPNTIESFEFSPKNQVDMLSKIIFPQSNESKNNILSDLNNIDMDKKLALIIKNSKELHKFARYEIDIVASVSAIFELNKITELKNIIFQKPTIRFGYETPKIIEELDLTDDYLDIFDRVLNIYNHMEQIDGVDESQICLLGHKQRALIELDGDNIAGLAKSNNKLAQLIAEQAAQVHPDLY